MFDGDPFRGFTLPPPPPLPFPRPAPPAPAYDMVQLAEVTVPVTATYRVVIRAGSGDSFFQRTTGEAVTCESCGERCNNFRCRAGERLCIVCLSAELDVASVKIEALRDIGHGVNGRPEDEHLVCSDAECMVCGVLSCP
ncbi:MAG TPA: hypothetical protein VK524_21640, partial [Polyangiaceae bacterium]|nr:hypothetical protein [Polyangiaceae bacterium]